MDTQNVLTANIIIAVFAGVLAVLGLFISLRRELKSGKKFGEWVIHRIEHLGPEMFAISILTLVTAFLVTRGEEEDRRSALIRLLRSEDNRIALSAVEELRANGWLQDVFSNQDGKNMSLVNFANVDLHGLDLEGVNFSSAILTNANLSGTILRNANLNYASLNGADLGFFSDLSGSMMVHAQLRGATLTNANLQGTLLAEADLSGADLTKAYLVGSMLSGSMVEGTIFPDGQQSNSIIDLIQFTDPDFASELFNCQDYYLPWYCTDNSATSSNLPGLWVGTLQQDDSGGISGLYEYALNIRQNGTTIEGLAFIRLPVKQNSEELSQGYWVDGVLQVEGQLSGNLIEVRDTRVLEQPPSNWAFWCRKTIEVSLEANQSRLAGTWTAPDCVNMLTGISSQGTIDLVRR